MGLKHPRVCSSSFLGFVLGIKRKPEEEEDDGGKEGSYNAIFVFSFSFLIFSSFDGCFPLLFMLSLVFLGFRCNQRHICMNLS